ncbi:MAG: ABC transporter substrate-binding protein [Sphingobium sp.]
MPKPPLLPLCVAPLLLASPLLSACSEQASGPVIVSVIGTPQDLNRPLQALPAPGAKLMMEATAQGLVAFDAGGEVLPALAQRWIVEDDGRSYIFRLRRAFWANGARVTAPDVARILHSRIETLRRLDPHGPLDVVETVVAMTGEVIEIRLAAARPYILQMLAQPQMGILARGGGTGPYRAVPHIGLIQLKPVGAPRGDDEDREAPTPPWDTRVLRAERAALAIARFRAGYAALVLGGRFNDLPLLTAAGIDRNAVRVDPVQGLLGLAVTGEGALLQDGPVRQALSMAIDRDQLHAAFPLGGWATTDQLVPQQLGLPTPPARPEWTALTMDERRARARAAVERWRADHGDPPAIRIALPPGAGSTLLYGLLAQQMRAIGLTAQRVDMTARQIDLQLIDEVAAYDSALWYLGRVGCARKLLCSKEAEARMQAANLASTPEDRAARIGEAIDLVEAHGGYIPLGAPVRWSLVSRRLAGFTPSPRARHPLNHLFGSTN